MMPSTLFRASSRRSTRTHTRPRLLRLGLLAAPLLFGASALGAVPVLVTGVAGPQASAAPASSGGGGACHLTGLAKFSPNGPGAKTTDTYSFTGKLATCESSTSGAPSSGTLAIGQVVTERVPIRTTVAKKVKVVEGTAKYREPVAKGTATVPLNSCVEGASSGTGIVSWAKGTDTIATFTTHNALTGVELEGTVAKSATLTLVPRSESVKGTAPSTYTIKTTNKVFTAGDSVLGTLVFTSTTPTKCTATSGLPTAKVQGLLAMGSAT